MAAPLLQKSACAVEALAKSQKRRPGPKDAVSGWTPVNLKTVFLSKVSFKTGQVGERCFAKMATIY
jgi:hypothetical protein